MIIINNEQVPLWLDSEWQVQQCQQLHDMTGFLVARPAEGAYFAVWAKHDNVWRPMLTSPDGPIKQSKFFQDLAQDLLDQGKSSLDIEPDLWHR